MSEDETIKLIIITVWDLFNMSFIIYTWCTYKLESLAVEQFTIALRIDTFWSGMFGLT